MSMRLLTWLKQASQPARARALRARMQGQRRLFELEMRLRALSWQPERPAGSRYPQPHPSVQARYVTGHATPVRFFPVNLDLKQAEVLATLLVDERHTGIVSRPDRRCIPVFLPARGETASPEVEAWFCRNCPRLSVFLDLHDPKQGDCLALSPLMWQAIAANRLRVLYFRLQIHDPTAYARLNQLPDLVHVLTMPLLLGGSRFHISAQPDFAGDGLFRTILEANPRPSYRYDWSWVGASTSDDRRRVFTLLDAQANGRAFYRVSIPNHTDAQRATVPYAEYIAASRASRVCLSLNGHGPWCLKDGELLAKHCFILRQHHPVVTLNPLTPRSGVHWVVFRDAELLPLLEHYAHHDEERERIRDAGHACFRQALLERTWASCYAERLLAFQASGAKSAWGELAIA